ncbi:LexA family protein [Hyphomicrobium sp.]|jgi:DNA polymerase V|uniref:LexA family protein n=1 Tax=Hyphomicrobium sp. TaxID=82 RepID=UPI003566960B
MTGYKGDHTTGFESPARDYIEPVVDLAAALDLRRPHKYPVRVVGQALRGRGIHDGDVLVVNAAAEPMAGRVCVAIVDAEVWLATLHFKHEQWWLKPSERAPRPVEGEVEIWAMVEALVRFDV